MANNHGTAILHFDTSTRSAITKTEQVITDAVPNPMDWPMRDITKGGYYTNRQIRYLGSNHWVITTINNTSYYSLDDGISWFQGTNTAGNSSWNIGSRAGIGLILDGGNTYTNSYKITAGTWNLIASGALPQPANWYSPVYNGLGRWLTIQTGVSGNVAAYSDNDGTTWTSVTSMVVETYSYLVWDGTYYIAITSSGSQRSVDGVTIWNSAGSFGVSGNWTGLASDGAGTTVVFRTTNNAVWYTKNGAVSWTEVILPVSLTTLSCRWTGNYFVALLSDTSGTFLKSFNGIEWTIYNTLQTAGNVPSSFDYNPVSGNAYIIEQTTGSGNPFKIWTSYGNIPYSGFGGHTIINNVIEVEPAYANIGSNVASVTVTGQTGLLATDNIDAWIQGSDSTSDHNAYEHKLAPIKLSVTNIVAGTGFDIIGLSEHRLDGDFKVRWAWAT